MKLNEFVDKFLQDNTLFRVLVNIDEYTTPISGDWETVSIVHLFKSGFGSFKKYAGRIEFRLASKDYDNFIY